MARAFPEAAVGPAPVRQRVDGRLARVRAASDRLAPQREAFRQLAAVPDIDGPRIRLGLAWAVTTFGFLVAGAIPLAVWLTAVALIAAGNTCKAWRKSDRRPIGPIAVFGAAAFPIGATFGPRGVGAVAAAVLVATAAWEPAAGALHQPARARTHLALTLAIAMSIGLAAASPVLVRQIGLVEAIVLLTLVGVYDASAYLVGSGAASPWEGPAAGAAFILAVTLAVAAVFVPPFRGLSPWLFGFTAAVLAPLGPHAASALLPEPRSRAPALRRLDSLLVLGPVWAVLALLVLA
jgi:hypothetical protein